MVQEQRQQLKMKLFLGYKMKIFVLWGDKIWQGTCFLVEKDYPRLAWMMMELQQFLELKPEKAVNFYEFFFTDHSQTYKYDFYVPQWKVETCYNLALKLIFFCIFTYVLFSINKSNFHFKERSSIRQIKQFVIFHKFQWNSVQPIWRVIINLIEITYTKVKYIIQTFLIIRRFSFFIGENNTKRNSGTSMLNQQKEVLCICVSFQESRDSIKEEPETNVYNKFLSYWRIF